MTKKRTKIANEDDEEVAVLIEKLVRWRWLLTMLGTVCVVMFMVVLIVGYDISRLEFFIFIGVLLTINILYTEKMRCPFCQKILYWPDRSVARSDKWLYVYCNLILLKKCPYCSRSLRVKKEKKRA